MAKINKERKEIKYIMSLNKYKELIERIEEELVPSEFYFSEIRNLYLDTPNYQLIRTSISKPIYKEKLRIRSYGDAKKTGKLFYEIKKKYEGVVYKRRFAIDINSPKDYSNPPTKFLEGDYGLEQQVIKEWNYCSKIYEELVPRYFVSYERYAYVGKEDPELRITFDSNLTWREDNLSLSGEIFGKKLLSNSVLMELKALGAIPMWLSRVLSDLEIFPMSFSKIGTAYSDSFETKEIEEILNYI